MQFNNFSLDTYCALVLLEACRTHYFPEYASDKPAPERENLIKKAWNALRRRFARKAAAAPVFDNVTHLAEYQNKPAQTLSGDSDPATDTCPNNERKAV